MERNTLYRRVIAMLAVILALAPAGCFAADTEETLPSVTVYDQPAPAWVIEGGWSAVFSVTADGAEAYQWQSNADGKWKNIAGQTKARLTRSAVKAITASASAAS